MCNKCGYLFGTDRKLEKIKSEPPLSKILASQHEAKTDMIEEKGNPYG